MKKKLLIALFILLSSLTQVYPKLYYKIISPKGDCRHITCDAYEYREECHIFYWVNSNYNTIRDRDILRYVFDGVNMGKKKPGQYCCAVAVSTSNIAKLEHLE